MIFTYLHKIKKKVLGWLHPVIGEIWCLHRVIPNRSIFKSNRELEITPEYLEQLIVEYKAKQFQFVDIDTIEKQIDCFSAKKMVNISFDDGFKDIYQYAYPIFKKHNVPFTIYLTTDFPEKKAFLWWMILEDIVLTNDRVFLSDGTTYSCKTKDDKQAVFETILFSIYSSGVNMFIYFMQLFDNYIDSYSSYSENLVLTWSEIIEMLDSGLCTLGSHSISHPDLTKLSSENIFIEINNSKRKIEDLTGRQVYHFSYPHSFYNKDIVELVKRSAYRTAVLGYGGKIRYRDDKFLLKRVYVAEK